MSSSSLSLFGGIFTASPFKGKNHQNKMKNKMTFLWDLSSITPLSLTHILTDAVEPWLMWFWLAGWIWGWYLHGRGPFLSILCFLKERLKKKVPAPMYQKIIIYGHSLKRPHLCDNWNVTLQITLKNKTLISTPEKYFVLSKQYIIT